ncbi:MAG: glycosyltransferase family 4 protein [Rhodospirillales bacterium]|nr:glycosyltransferase family 4 protein [Rhodospirillales bacterium]
MHIAFHAPLKPPHHPTPSGDREMARLLVRAMERGGFVVELATPFRSLDASGNPQRQRRLSHMGERLADRIIERNRRRPLRERPDLWFTYHLYHKAPDLIGPQVSGALGIPYVVAEASHAAKQEDGPWALGHAAAAEAIASADLLINLNSADAEGLRHLVNDPHRVVPLKPFIDASSFQCSASMRNCQHAALARRFNLDEREPLLLAVAMMRDGDKLDSYRVLGEALSRITSRPWHLLVVGDGPAASKVETALRDIGDRVIYLGRQERNELTEMYAACDLYVWPAVREAYGLALMEAQAAGLPVIAGRTGGVPDVVADGETGLLVTPGDADAFGNAVARLLADPAYRMALGNRAAARVRRDHDLPVAAANLACYLSALTDTRQSKSGARTR